VAAGLALMVSSAATGVVIGAGTAGATTLTPLVGTFGIAAGTYSAAKGAGGSYFRMLDPGGTPNAGDTAYVPNSSSTASDKTYTLLTPGTEGGLVTGQYQPAPTPAFDATGNALADKIIKPTGFEAINFSVETQTPDPQATTAVPTPSISANAAGHLSGNLEALSASWNKLYFNQGSPKPGGTSPGLTAGPTGTYNPTTRAFEVTWTSEIVGGPFNDFTGQWVLAGTFVPAGLYITNTSLHKGVKGSKYAAVDLKAAHGVGKETWKAKGLPKGLALSSAGVLSGTVSAGDKAETYAVSITATDSTKPKSQTAITKFGLVIT
jgi:hypothetical protein